MNSNLLQPGMTFDSNTCGGVNLSTNLGSSLGRALSSSANSNNSNNTSNRSQNSSTNTGSNSAISLEAHPLIDFTTTSNQQQNNLAPTNFYSLNDMNLFNALGLNLTNNQLVLSLQQQSLIQAAAVARQYELNQNCADSDVDRERLHNENGSGNSINEEETINLIQHNYSPIQRSTEARKQLLKFSINTILGRGSPQLNAVNEPGSMKPMIYNQQQHLAFSGKAACKEQVGSKLVKSMTDEDCDDQVSNAVDVECDPLESISDSSSISTSTPNPPTSSSNIFSHSSSMLSAPNHNPQHPSATSNSLNTLHVDTNGQQHLFHHRNVQRQQQQHHQMQFLPGSTAFPWTVAARGKPRRGMMRRAVFSDSQRVGLEKRFQLQKYISKPDRKKLAEKLGLRDSQVKIWFQNRRMKWRNSKERELLSAGGSREQTLPTRNNPNPDLSDVGETIKRITGLTNSNNNIVSTISPGK